MSFCGRFEVGLLSGLLFFFFGLTFIVLLYFCGPSDVLPLSVFGPAVALL